MSIKFWGDDLHGGGKLETISSHCVVEDTRGQSRGQEGQWAGQGLVGHWVTQTGISVKEMGNMSIKTEVSRAVPL